KREKEWTNKYDYLVSQVEDTEVLFEFFQDNEASEEEVNKQFDKALSVLEKLEFQNMLSAEEDQLDAILQITAGAGGTESCDWASILMRMYLMWGEKHGRSEERRVGREVK